MRLTIDVALEAEISPGDPVLLMVEVASGPGQEVSAASLTVADAALRRPGQGGMVWATVPGTRFALRYQASVDVSRTAAALEPLNATPLPALPGAVLPFLRPSRYCPSDLFADFAERQFGALEGGAKVAAIRNWVAAELAYVPGSSNSATTAVETFADRQGVCRDFAHMLCTLARAAQIPARYVSAYGAEVTPPDFHALSEVWLDGAWHLVDATDMGAPHEMAVIAVGRDAGDVAFMETAEWAVIQSQSVRVTQG